MKPAAFTCCGLHTLRPGRFSAYAIVTATGTPSSRPWARNAIAGFFKTDQWLFCTGLCMHLYPRPTRQPARRSGREAADAARDGGVPGRAGGVAQERAAAGDGDEDRPFSRRCASSPTSTSRRSRAWTSVRSRTWPRRARWRTVTRFSCWDLLESQAVMASLVKAHSVHQFWSGHLRRIRCAADVLRPGTTTDPSLVSNLRSTRADPSAFCRRLLTLISSMTAPAPGQ